MAAVSVIREAANKSAVRLGYSLGMKEEQMEVVVAFMTGKDVFAVLPTGFGKSLICYACLPFAFAEVEKSEETERPIVVVVTPLTAIMKDQVSCGRRLTCSTVMMTPICFKG